MDQVPLIPIRQFMRSCRKGKNELKFVDSTGVEMNGGRALLTALAFKKVLHRLLANDEKNVGLILPTSVYGVLANLGLALDRRTAVNLNYTFNAETINDCVERAEIKHVITSRKVLERFPGLTINADLIIMEDVARKVTLLDKLTCFIDAYFTPIPCLEWVFGLDQVSPDDLLTIIFTSGSTGTPKGAMITHHNVASNVGAFFHQLDLTSADRIFGTLPLFHAYGYTATFWLPAMTDVKGVYHFNPLEPKKVAETAKRYHVTAFPTTPTFLRKYLRKSLREDYDFIDTVICGAEKMPTDLIDIWEEKFGVRPVEGYGATELSPVVATNVPKGRRSDYLAFSREGTIGRPLVNLQARVVQPESIRSDGLSPIVLASDGETPGMLQIKGPSVMKGYYKDAKKTTEVIQDGWYSTGDIATIDKDGFIKIVGRESRISKIGGEMVPHILIEDEITKIIAGQQTDENGEIRIAVSAVPDERKGERLVILHTELSQTPEAICKALQGAGLPNLWIPSPNDFHRIETIPVLGTGKLDLRAIKELAKEYL